MSLSLFDKPSLAEFLMVVAKMPDDEKAQFEALGDEPFDVERIAAKYFLRDCPKWVIYGGEEPIAIAGFDHLGNGVYQDWMFSTPTAWEKHGRALTRLSKRVMDHMLAGPARRLQCVSLASRIHAHRWYGALGLTQEGTLHGIGREGEDAFVFSRLRSTDG